MRLKIGFLFMLCLASLVGLVIIRDNVSDILRGTLNFSKGRIVSSLGKWSTDPVSLGSNLSGVTISPGPTQQLEFTAAIEQRLNSSQGVILLAMVDTSFVKLAINFYKTSLQPFQIENYLLVGISGRACALLSEEGLPCFNMQRKAPR